jgi:hypothetical protein
MTNPLRHLIVVGLLAAASAAPMAFAAEPPGGACRDDTKRLCASVQPGRGRVMACLQQHEADLSAGCKSALPVMQRCAQDVKAACAGAGKRGMRECVRNQSDKLSPECKTLAPQR